MAQLITVRLNKADQQPLGFRLQGGKDFGTPLVVQKVSKYLLQVLNNSNLRKSLLQESEVIISEIMSQFHLNFMNYTDS